MKMRIIAIAIVVMIYSTLFADPPVPIAYSNEVKTLRFERIIDWSFAPGSTNLVMGYKSESTNWPSAIIHVVTYGHGTNVLFLLWCCELLPEPGEPWQNREFQRYIRHTWITKP